ncbi:MAG: chemotaxis protein CheW [Pseudomonadota bacterium]
MSDETNEVQSLLIPLADKTLLIPRSNVMEVISLNELEDNPGSVPWFVGSAEWEGSLIPVVSFEGICGDDLPPSAGRSRVVLVRCLTDHLNTRAFGLISQGFPQLVRVQEDALSLEPQQFGESLPVLCQVTMASQSPLIPDIEKLERLVSDALAVTS